MHSQLHSKTIGTPSVYFVQLGCKGLIKIGYTEHPEHRLYALHMNNPGEIRLLGRTAAPNIELEKKLHKRFRSTRVGGEWFLPSTELLDYIQKNTEEPQCLEPKARSILIEQKAAVAEARMREAELAIYTAILVSENHVPITDMEDFNYVRAACLTLLRYAYSLNSKELQTLNTRDLRQNESCLILYIHNERAARSRLVLLDALTKKLLKTYLAYYKTRLALRSKSKDAATPLFFSISNRSCGRLSIRGINSIINEFYEAPYDLP